MTSSSLVVLDALPLPLTEGDRLRSYHLGRAIAAEGRCHLAVLQADREQLSELQQTGPFDRILALPARPPSPAYGRHLRLDNGGYLRHGWPRWWRETRQALVEFINLTNATTVIAGKLPVAELVAGLPGARRVVDDFDCYTLTLEREYALERPVMTWPQRLTHRLAQWRYRRQEAGLAHDFDLVTTISPADGARLRELNPDAPIEVVPNGVSDALLGDDAAPDAPTTRGVAFWGNLAFAPNRSAVQWFIEQVYDPYLQAHDLPCYLIGGGADDWIRALPSRYGAVRVLGFVEDLASVVKTVPIMINPMVSGSGLKNKMLEAMALRRAIVSTPMGSEAIDAVAG
ncbi:MAG: glycosyltransferase, partial [Pseudomonadota bacterium]